MSQTDDFIASAKAQVGKPYKWGTAGPDTFDCSGLVAYCYQQATGAVLTHDSHEQFTLGVGVQEAQPGDLLFFDTMAGQEVRHGNAASHVGIAISPTQMVNALNPKKGVVVSNPQSAYFAPLLLGIRRIMQPPAQETKAPVQAPVVAPQASPVVAPTPPQPQPPAVVPSAPTGPIQTLAPGNQSFGIDWSAINVYDPLIGNAANEFSVPFGRIKAVIPIESRGKKDAIQRNSRNGDSFGLMQIVPYGIGWEGWHAKISTLAKLSSSASHDDVIRALADPGTNIRVGTSILKDLFTQYGTWDAANSAFFTGTKDWNGSDNVNKTTGAQYQAALNGLLQEIWSAAGTTSNVPGPSDGLHFGLPAWPAGFEVRLLDLAPNGQGWDDLGARTLGITVCHHTAGNDNRDSVYGLFSRGGGRWGQACTDAVIDRTGHGYLLLDAWGVSKNVTPWASGPATSLKGIGVQIVQQLGANAVNKAGFSTEHCNVDGQGFTDAQIALSTKVYGNVITRMHIPWDQWPTNPALGLRIDAVHDRFAPTSCPGADWPWGGSFHTAWVQGVAHEAKILQTGSAPSTPVPVPAPTDPPALLTKYGLPIEQITDYFGTLTRFNADGAQDDLPFNPTGVLSNVWLERFGPTGVFPEAESMKAYDSKLAEGKEWFATFEGGYTCWLPIDNMRATWRWLDQMPDTDIPK